MALPKATNENDDSPYHHLAFASKFAAHLLPDPQKHFLPLLKNAIVQPEQEHSSPDIPQPDSKPRTPTSWL
jgi:hypothetical protein